MDAFEQSTKTALPLVRAWVSVDATSPDFCAHVGRSIELVPFLPLGEMLAEALTLGDFFTRYTQAVSEESNAVNQALLVEGEFTYFQRQAEFQGFSFPRTGGRLLGEHLDLFAPSGSGFQVGPKPVHPACQ